MWLRCKRAEDEDRGRAALRCGQRQGGRHLNSPCEPRSRLSLPGLAPRMTFSTALGKLHHFWTSLSPPKNKVAAFMPLQQCWEDCYCLQRAPKNHQPLCELYPGDEVFSPQNTPSSYCRSCESWHRCSAVCRAGIQVGPQGRPLLGSSERSILLLMEICFQQRH